MMIRVHVGRRSMNGPVPLRIDHVIHHHLDRPAPASNQVAEIMVEMMMMIIVHGCVCRDRMVYGLPSEEKRYSWYTVDTVL